MPNNWLNNRKRRPTHPGEILREDVLPAAGLTHEVASGVIEARSLMCISKRMMIVGGKHDACFLPEATREIRELHGHTAIGYGRLAQRAGYTPRSCVVYIDIWFKPLAHTLDQPVAHDVIHTTVASNLSSRFALLLPKQCLVL